ncbi:MAG: CNNM domain-containing protein, partial [Acidobacteria bacterium]|nr:CNNM domain-containing protein [Acidobacteriota bacterium]
MFILLPTLIVLLSLLLTLFSYVNRLYSEKGRFLIRGSQDNVDFFEDHVEPKLKVEMEKAGFTFPLLVRVNLIVLAMMVTWWNLSAPLHWHMLAEAGVFLVLDVMLFAQVIPNILLTRTSGKWLLSVTGLLRFCVLLVFPLVAVSRFLYDIATLGKESEREGDKPSASENIEALIQAGEEEGLLEEEDRKLIRSVVEFGDKTVREVMTPRLEIFAVPAETPL